MFRFVNEGEERGKDEEEGVRGEGRIGEEGVRGER